MNSVDLNQYTEEEMYRHNKVHYLSPEDFAAQKNIKQATVILDDLIERIIDWNSLDSDFAIVSKVWVFGSFLYKKEGLNDLDVFIELDYPSAYAFDSNEKEMDNEVNNLWVHIKGEDPFLAIHTSSDGVFNKCEKQIVYDFDSTV